MTSWQEFVIKASPYDHVYEYEYNCKGQYTGWCRCKDSVLADGTVPEHNYKTGETRYTENEQVVRGPFVKGELK